jgi:release factor glutamine methyltransferase
VNTQNSNAFTLHRILLEACGLLEKAGFSRGAFEAEYLLQALLGSTRAELFLHGDTIVDPVDVVNYQTMLRRRLKYEPLQYIVGEVEFWSREFQVSPAVLIPRQETEFVLEQILLLVRRQTFSCKQILDMGTGSGVIADVLADELNCHVVAVDCSQAALDIAYANISRHHLLEKTTFICSDLFTAIHKGQHFDLIVSNPPYVAESEKKDLHPEVTLYEPATALFAGCDGLDCYQRLIPESFEYLRPGGWLCMEIGASQGGAISKMLHINGYQEVTILTDYADRPRLAFGKK